MLYPLQFSPIFKARVWGGRALAQLFQKRLPPGQLIGESWEISDRPGDVSIVSNGPLAGTSLHELLHAQPQALLGTNPPPERFPLLVKILDAKETLSLQVHPPASVARQLNGEPKTEMWYIAHAEPGAQLFAGLKCNVSRAEFERKLQAATVADCFHRLPVQTGDAMFVPSGRVHAVGAGCVIFEIQQNSDTTYRVFDWNRSGLDGKPRPLHIQESLASIDFADFEPILIPHQFQGPPDAQKRPLVQSPHFTVDYCAWNRGVHAQLQPGQARIIGLLHGQLRLSADNLAIALSPGEFSLVPARSRPTQAEAVVNTAFLDVQLP